MKPSSATWPARSDSDLEHRDDAAGLGYERTDDRASVDWDALAGTHKLSSTAIGVVHLARGCAIIERHDGLPTRLAKSVVDAVTAVVR